MKQNNRKVKAATLTRRARLQGMKDGELHDLANMFRPTKMESDQYQRAETIEFILRCEGLLGREV